MGLDVNFNVSYIGIFDILDEGNGIWEVLGWTLSSLWVERLHDLDLDTEDTLSEEDVSDGIVNKVSSGLTRVDHESVGELHGFGSGSSEFTRDNDLTTLGAGFHDESEDTVTGSRYQLGYFGDLLRARRKRNSTHRRMARPPRSLYLKDSA